MACEKCWEDAYKLSRSNYKSQADNYINLLADRGDTPCGPQYDSKEYFRVGGLGNPVEDNE